MAVWSRITNICLLILLRQISLCRHSPNPTTIGEHNPALAFTSQTLEAALKSYLPVLVPPVAFGDKFRRTALGRRTFRRENDVGRSGDFGSAG